MKFLHTVVASIALFTLSGSVFATTYFSIQEKSDAIQQVRTEANAANSLYKLSIEKFNNDRANFTQQDQIIADEALAKIRNAGDQIAEIQHALIAPVPNVPVSTTRPLVSLTPSIKPQGVPTPKYNTISLVGSHLDSNVTDAQRIASILENVPKAVNGVDGKKGAKGDTGATGAQGVAGINGRNGVNGHNGKDGVTTTVTRIQVDTATQTKVADNSQAITTTTQDLQATKQTLQAMNNNTSQQFKSLRDEVDNNKKQANAGISGAMAMAGLPQVQTNQHVMFSVGGATYNSESALAVGASVNVNSHTIAKFSFSDDTANNMGASVGVGIGF